MSALLQHRGGEGEPRQGKRPAGGRGVVGQGVGRAEVGGQRNGLREPIVTVATRSGS